MTTKSAHNRANRDALRFLKSERLLEGTSLAGGVEDAIRQGHELTTTQAGILW
jgi:hypothetical protein